MGRNKGKAPLSKSVASKPIAPIAGLSNRKKKALLWQRRVSLLRNSATGEEAGWGSSYRAAHEIDHTQLITGRDKSLGNCVAMDCEFVGTGLKGRVSMLGRCSVVNHDGHVLYDTYVAPLAPVTDYRTLWSGIRKEDLVGAPDFETVQEKVKEFLRGRILVGHDLRHDLTVLDLEHPKSHTRDTSTHTFNPFTKLTNGKKSKLSTQLGNVRPDVDIQQGEHSSIEDAQAAMLLYQSTKVAWERSFSSGTGSVSSSASQYH